MSHDRGRLSNLVRVQHALGWRIEEVPVGPLHGLEVKPAQDIPIAILTEQAANAPLARRLRIMPHAAGMIVVNGEAPRLPRRSLADRTPATLGLVDRLVLAGLQAVELRDTLGVGRG